MRGILVTTLRDKPRQTQRGGGVNSATRTVQRCCWLVCRSSRACAPSPQRRLYVYLSAKRNIRNECAILIRRVKGMLREECGYAPCLTLRH